MQSALIRSLTRARAFPHPTRDIRLLETHISWILLTGDFVYKLKKPLNLGFLDFSTLVLRRHFCEEELRLNRRLVPELYLDVVEIRGSPEAPFVVGSGDIGGSDKGEVLDYAVRMHQFDSEHQLDIELDSGALDVEDMEPLASTVAAIHAAATRAGPASEWGDLAHVMDPVRANLAAVRGADSSPAWQARIEALEAHTVREGARLAPLFAARKAGGFVRECHGDLHLSNLVRLDAGFRAFDCIEFSPALRWVDVASDVAFLIMDLQVRGRDDLALRFANEYLELTGDFEGVQLLDFYLAYRSLVRAKVVAVRLEDAELAGDARASARDRLERHVSLAERYREKRPRSVVIMNGVSGSGKSWLARRLLAPLEAFRVRSDVERKRLEGLDRFARTGSAGDEGIYTARTTEATYARLAELALEIVAGGYPAIVDATCLSRAQRAVILEALAGEPRTRCVVVRCHAPVDVLEARVAERAREGRDVSEADVAILRRQLETLDPVEAEECDSVIHVDTSENIDLDGLVAKILDA